MTHRLRTVATGLSLAMLAACSGGPSRPKGLAPPPAVVAATPAEIDAVFDLLMTGKEDEARKQLKKLLKRDPMSANAALLNDSLEREPKELLGPQSYAYTVRSGDSVIGLAERLLGNRLKAYQLVRYNGLKPPVLLTPGQVLRIPGEPPRAEPVRRAEPATPRPTPPAATPKLKASAPKPATPTAPAAAAANPGANPAAARAARAAGLAALNGGDVNRAVGLLRRAAALDPGNPVVARDLARAERIAATVRARR